MLILVTKDSATRIPKEVLDLGEANTFAHNGFCVHVVQGGVEFPLADAQAAAEAGFDSVVAHREAVAEEVLARDAAAKKAEAEKAVADAEEALSKADTDEDKADASQALEEARTALAALG